MVRNNFKMHIVWGGEQYSEKDDLRGDQHGTILEIDNISHITGAVTKGWNNGLSVSKTNEATIAWQVHYIMSRAGTGE